ncbi:MAG: AAA family ATPase [Clostridia bacterium]|nr:AAA family ATPase [Clostridia bacterium]MDD4376076.1 AAA family ATPase [Clostridia bacterium]
MRNFFKKFSDKKRCIRCGRLAKIGFNGQDEPFIVEDDRIKLCDVCLGELYDDMEDQMEEAYQNAINMLADSGYLEEFEYDEEDEERELEIDDLYEEHLRKKEKNLNAKNQKELPNIIELEKTILKRIIGQDEQVRTAISEIYNSHESSNPSRNFEEEDTLKTVMLIMGGTGSGKSEMIKQIAKELDIPCTKQDATEFTEEGYVGRSVREIIKDLIEAAKNDISKAERGIIIIDEIDKKATRGEMTGRDVSGVGVLQSLLKMTEDGSYQVRVNGQLKEFSTKNVKFIFAGAFSGIEEIAKQRSKKQIGFVNETSTLDCVPEINTQDIVKYGLSPEFVGRMNVLIKMNEVSESLLERIMVEGEISELAKLTRILERNNIKLELYENFVKDVASEAIKQNMGARAISKILRNVFRDVLRELLTNPSKYTKCSFLKGIVEDNKKYILS